MSAQYHRITVDLQPFIARITLNNPPLNIIDREMIDDLSLALADIERRPGILAIVFAGSERVFSAGVDIGSHEPRTFEPMLRKFHAVIDAIAWAVARNSPSCATSFTAAPTQSSASRRSSWRRMPRSPW